MTPGQIIVLILAVVFIGLSLIGFIAFWIEYIIKFKALPMPTLKDYNKILKDDDFRVRTRTQMYIDFLKVDFVLAVILILSLVIIAGAIGLW